VECPKRYFMRVAEREADPHFCVVDWTTGGRRASPRRVLCAPIKCGCAWRQWPTSSCARCGNMVWQRRSWCKQCNTIRVRLLKIGAVIGVHVRRVTVALSEAYRLRELFVRVWEKLRAVAPGVRPAVVGWS
jgi:hypothetical protein